MNRSLLCLLIAWGSSACNATVEAGSDLRDGGTAPSTANVDATASGGNGDAGFVCTLAVDATSAGGFFSGISFDPTGGCLTGTAVPLPICGCYHGAGLGFSTWCFADPSGNAYFASSDDDCDIEVPAGWYAQQTIGPSPGLTANAAQQAACAALVADLKPTGSYELPAPPVCDARGSATYPDCQFDAATFEFNGAKGNALQDVQGLACSGTATCTESIVGTPFCGDIGSHFDGYRCTCQGGKVVCVVFSQGGGISRKGWCDGGDGRYDAGR